MKLLGYLAIFLSTFAVIDTVAPNDYSITCRTDFQYRVAHDWIPYANNTSSGTWKVLIDQYDYQSIIGADPSAVWKVIDADTQPTPDRITFTQGSGGTCSYQIRVSNSYRNPNSNNWVFTQAIDYIDAVELIINATVRFSACVQRRADSPPCRNDYVILHRYDTNTLSETQRVKPANYQPYNGTSESSRLEQDQVNTNTDTIIGRFRRLTNFNYTYLGLQDIGTHGIIHRIFMYYEVCPGRVEGLVTYPEVPHPGTLPGASSRTTRLARCAEHSHNTTSLETYAYQDGRCDQSATCDCDAKYEENGRQCIACTPGKYRSTLNSSCVDCPANSNSLSAASECSCSAGYYRVSGSEGIGVGCTAPPPPISNCNVGQQFDTAITIQWRSPANCGGRSDCYYQIKINNDSPKRHSSVFRPNTQETFTVENLQPATTYAITVSIHNGVSDQDPDNAENRKCVIVATTIQGSVFMFGGIIYPNNTAVILEHIGDDSFICTTSHSSCCQTGVQGNFYYPNGEPVLSHSEASSPGQSFYQTHNHGSISLKQKPGEIFPPLGRYRCEIPDGRGTLQNLFFTIGTIQERECPTIPPKVIIPDIYFELNGEILTNNSAVDLNNIGEGEGALLCKTNHPNCCGTRPNRFGQFFYPNGRQVPIRVQNEGFYRNRGEQRIRLNRREGVTSPTGRFRCEIPDANGVMKSVYITIN